MIGCYTINREIMPLTTILGEKAMVVRQQWMAADTMDGYIYMASSPAASRCVSSAAPGGITSPLRKVYIYMGFQHNYLFAFPNSNLWPELVVLVCNPAARRPGVWIFIHLISLWGVWIPLDIHWVAIRIWNIFHIMWHVPRAHFLRSCKCKQTLPGPTDLRMNKLFGAHFYFSLESIFLKQKR